MESQQSPTNQDGIQGNKVQVQHEIKLDFNSAVNPVRNSTISTKFQNQKPVKKSGGTSKIGSGPVSPKGMRESTTSKGTGLEKP